MKKDKTKIEPMPCPFCGKTPKVFPLDSEIGGNAWAEVRCVNKKCSANPCVSDGTKIIDERGSEKYKKAAIKRWNKRF